MCGDTGAQRPAKNNNIIWRYLFFFGQPVVCCCGIQICTLFSRLTGTIKFINIVSEEDEEQNVSTTDFDELINNYINGTAFEEANPNFNVISKELCEENGVLNGQVEFTFEDLQDIGFYHYQRSEHAPIMFYLGSFSETLLETDGEYLGGAKDEEGGIPMIIWAPGTTEFTFKTAVKDEMSNTHTLLDHYNLWLEVNK